MRLLILSCIFLLANSVYAQIKHDYNIVLGHESSSIFLGAELYSLNFNNPPDDQFDIFDGAFDLWFSTTTMSDSEGNLIFYSNGCQVANANHEIMMGGDSINVGPYFFDRDCADELHPEYSAYNAGTQSILALPHPYTDSVYYLLHLRKELSPLPNEFARVKDVLLTTIDMNLDGGKGGVVQKDQSILNGDLSLGYLVAVRHADNQRWWLNTSTYDSDEHIFILLGEGVDTIQYQVIGPAMHYGFGFTGQRVFSPDGTMMAHYDKRNHLLLFDFDRATGLLSNERQLFLNDAEKLGGVCFASNNRYLYVSSRDTLYQLDVEAPDLEASKTIVAIYDGYTDPFTLNFYQMERGPDCKIYINSTAGAQNLHVIMSPDSPGLACDVRQHYLQLPFPRDRNLLNAPNYRLGTPYPTCDSTINVVSSSTEPIAPPPITDGGVRIFPNPARERATVAFDLPFHGTLTLHDAHGRELLHQTAGGLAEYDLNLGALPGGVYFVRATTREGFVRTVRLVRMWE